MNDGMFAPVIEVLQLIAGVVIAGGVAWLLVFLWPSEATKRERLANARYAWIFTSSLLGAAMFLWRAQN